MITSLDNSKVKKIRALLTRGRERRKEGLYVVEGLRICREIPKDLIEEIYISESFEVPDDLKALLGEKGCEVLSNDCFMKAADTVSPQGILCIVRMKKAEIPKGPAPLYVILEDIQDPGNLGTILRTAEGAGVTGVFVSKGSAELYSPKVVRATMGSLYRLPIAEFDDMEALLAQLRSEGVTTFATCPDGSVDYLAPDYNVGCAFIIGNEGNGIQERTAALADHHILIPMEGSLESLNASVAAGLVMYEAYNQRRNYKKMR